MLCYILAIFNFTLKRCCGKCGKYSIVKQYPTLKEFVNNKSSIESDFVYPILAEMTATYKYGYRFIPIIEAADPLYIANAHSQEETAKNLLTACWNLWPLLLICVMLAFIAGAFAWVMVSLYIQ